MSAVDGIQEPDLVTIVFSTSEHINIYKKEMVGLPESDRYDLTRSQCADFHQDLKDDISTFGLKIAVLIVTAKDVIHAPTEVKETILSYIYITQVMVESYCEILWDYNPGAGLGNHTK